MEVPKPPLPVLVPKYKSDSAKPIAADPKPKSNSKVTLLVLTHILTAVVVGSVFFFFNIPSQKDIEDAAKIREGKEMNFRPTPPLVYGSSTELQPLSVVKLELPSGQYRIWTENNVTYTITGAEYGTYKQDVTPWNSKTQVTKTISAIIFTYKFFSEEPACVSLPTLRRMNGANDFLAPMERQVYVKTSGGCAAEGMTTYTDQKLTFEVPPSAEFDFTYPLDGQLGTFMIKPSGSTLILE